MNTNEQIKKNLLASYNIEKTTKKKVKYTDEQLKELIDEHEKLIPILESEDHEDDKEEAKEQKKELKGYKKDISKAFDLLGIFTTKF